LVLLSKRRCDATATKAELGLADARVAACWECSIGQAPAQVNEWQMLAQSTKGLRFCSARFDAKMNRGKMHRTGLPVKQTVKRET